MKTIGGFVKINALTEIIFPERSAGHSTQRKIKIKIMRGLHQKPGMG